MVPMNKRHKISSWRLIIYAKNCVVGCTIGEIRYPHQVQDLKIVFIDQGPRLPLVNLSLHLHAWIGRGDIVKGTKIAHSLRAWEMMQ